MKKMTKYLACLSLDCAKAQKHVASCVAYGQPYPPKVINYLDDRPGIFDGEPKMDTKLKKKFEEKCLELSYKYDNEITLAIDDLWSFIHSAVESERKQLEREIIKKIKTWEKTVECPLYVCCQDCYELSIDDVLDLLKKETI